jgi:cell division cycle 20, cofactor of APC complex
MVGGTHAIHAREGCVRQNNLSVLYSQNRAAATANRKPSRHIPQAPLRVLDAPELLDDFYCNVLDWSEENVLAVGLGRNVYAWNAATGDINLVMTTAENDLVTSLSWAAGGTLAVGTQMAEVQIWDAERAKRLRTMRGMADRVPSLAWNKNILSSGCRNGVIYHSDVRVADHLVGSLHGHTQEVCGLKWSPDGEQLASGGNDNVVNIWGVPTAGDAARPLHTFTHHTAAVKALAWCPWQNHLLASGGGSADRHIRFWNTQSGACVNAIDTQSQVCSLVWSKQYREIVSSHGIAKNQLTIWRYPSLTKVTELYGHTSRVLHTAISPDGEKVASASGDETLRLWHCFAPAEGAEGAARSVAATKAVVPKTTGLRGHGLSSLSTR